MSQEAYVSEEGCSFRAELISLRIAGIALNKPCSAVVDEATCCHSQRVSLLLLEMLRHTAV